MKNQKDILLNEYREYVKKNKKLLKSYQIIINLQEEKINRLKIELAILKENKIKKNNKNYFDTNTTDEFGNSYLLSKEK